MRFVSGKRGNMGGSITMDRLRDSLEGVFDFDNPKDCEKVIGSLLKSLNESRKRQEEAEERLKELVRRVKAGDPSAVSFASGEEGKGKGMGALGFILKMAGEMDSVSSLSDSELANELMNGVWASYDISGRESALLGEAIKRLKECVDRREAEKLVSNLVHEVDDKERRKSYFESAVKLGLMEKPKGG